MNQRMIFCIALAACAVSLGAQQQPAAPQWQTTPTMWESGAYAYDGAGNIVAIGTDRYRYDGAGRLVSATAHTPAYANTQAYQYDIYGNRIRVDTQTTAGAALAGSTVIAVDPNSNRLIPNPPASICPPGVVCITGVHDAAGNQTLSNGWIHYDWDALGNMTKLEVGERVERYIYDASNERIATVRPTMGGGEQRHYTLRGSDAKVVRELTDVVSATGTHQWSWTKDYVYRHGKLLASISPSASGDSTRHFHLDHLGTARLITDARGFRLSAHTYWPFGEEAPGSETDDERMKFTGHERDFGRGPGEDLDYMHARYYTPVAGRFSSVDPVLDRKLVVQAPQGWNRYSYVRCNPVNAVDPTGMLEALLYGKKVDVNPGDVVVLVNRNGEAAHVAIVGGFEKTKQGWEVLIYENVPINRVNSLEDSAKHLPTLVNSNSPKAGAGIWNTQKGYTLGGVASNKAMFLGLLPVGSSRFTTFDVARAVRSVGPVRYDNRKAGEFGVTCDCAGFVNKVVEKLRGTQTGTRGYGGPGKNKADWLAAVDDDD